MQEQYYFILFSFYSQVEIHQSDLELPGNMWEEEHVNQGFSWRPGSVSFGLLIDTGYVHTKIYLSNIVGTDKEPERRIVVPFRVSPSGLVKVSDTVRDELIEIPQGNYRLTFEVGRLDKENEWCNLYFYPQEKVTPEIFVSGDLNPSYPLLMHANPA
ncbi:MAG: hypothetical protein HC921_21785 [Synechococcaceae cyanobacterium SM2_3_1]|nr:hypothetical protein [Synechococcaceae cyanobacterium SM2_3_1]